MEEDLVPSIKEDNSDSHLSSMPEQLEHYVRAVKAAQQGSVLSEFHPSLGEDFPTRETCPLL